MFKSVFIAVFFCVAGLLGQSINDAAANSQKKELVILVHGLGRSSASMWLIDDRLQNMGYKTCRVDYRSRELGLVKLIEDLGKEIGKCTIKYANLKSIHFVTHSLGGPLVRAYFGENEMSGLGRVVMLSPPNSGSPLVDFANQFQSARDILGPTAAELHTGPDSWLARLPKPDYEVGIIGGDITFNPVAAYLLPGRDDGVVPLSHMWMEGMTDFTSVQATHVTIRYSKAASENIASFLQNGSFAN
ncbi:esterase/lipase family protein [Sneathiella glossodoripedis]|uniref:esterase/lipase family protein n=1 Tax=Sneathiella glossodoripedis TaxID=418853 RepID=UPI00046EF901|nr:alpha/beta fold hydrolase [Sneathiella glossodoripedis]